MNRFLPCLSVRISHRRCEQRHTNLRNAGWFLGCVFCFHCLIIHIFFWKCHHQFIQWEKELIYILFTMFNESLSLFPSASPWKLSLQATAHFPTDWAVIGLCLTAGNSSGTHDKALPQLLTASSVASWDSRRKSITCTWVTYSVTSWITWPNNLGDQIFRSSLHLKLFEILYFQMFLIFCYGEKYCCFFQFLQVDSTFQLIFVTYSLCENWENKSGNACSHLYYVVLCAHVCVYFNCLICLFIA